MIEDKDIPQDVLKCGFQMPKEYYHVFKRGMTNLDPWYFIEGNELRKLYEGINLMYSNRLVFPFARRRDTDDVACFVVRGEYPQGQVLIVHIGANPGWEVDVHSESFQEWYKVAVD